MSCSICCIPFVCIIAAVICWPSQVSDAAQHGATQPRAVQHSAAQHSATQRSGAQCNTAQSSATQRSEAQCNTAQRRPVQHSAEQCNKPGQHSTAQRQGGIQTHLAPDRRQHLHEQMLILPQVGLQIPQHISGFSVLSPRLPGV